MSKKRKKIKQKIFSKPLSKDELEKFFKDAKKTEVKLSMTISMVLRSHLLAERYMDKFIEDVLPKGNIITNNFSFYNKLKIIRSFGIFPSRIFTSLEALNSLRNDCVHIENYRLLKRSIDKIGFSLGDYYLKLKQKRYSKQQLLRVTIYYLLGYLIGFINGFKKMSKGH